MAVLDWPTDRAFAPVQPGGYLLGLRSPKSGFAGFYTGALQTQGHASDRLLATLTLPACDPAAAARREAYLCGLVSTGDWVRLGHLLRPVPGGSIAGSPAVAATAASGARSVQVSGALAGANLLANGGFEIDSNADGIADGWGAYSAGTFTGAAFGAPPGNGSATAQRIFAASLGSGLDDAVGVYRPALQPVTAGLQYSLGADWTASASTFRVELYVDWVNAGGGAITATRQSWVAPIGWTRLAMNGIVAPAGAVNARIYAWIHQASSGTNLQAYLDNVQWERAALATPYAGLPTLLGGDVLGVNGDLLLTASQGVTLNDAGAGTVPLALPLKRVATAGSALSWSAPKGRFQLLGDEIRFEHGWGSWQSRISLPFLEV